MPVRTLTSVWIDERARVVIETEALRRRRVETGGALFGFGSDCELVVTCAYGPGPRARPRRRSFEPHAATTEALMHAVRHSSECRYRYLGSWHSHPDGAPRPSGTDVLTTENVANEPEVGLPRPLVMIQATELRPGAPVLGQLRAWHWSSEESWLLPCELDDTWLEEHFCPCVKITAGRIRRKSQTLTAHLE
jgi:integrative and conjugative element protein (TIGR02256 family)